MTNLNLIGLKSTCVGIIAGCLWLALLAHAQTTSTPPTTSLPPLPPTTPVVPPPPAPLAAGEPILLPGTTGGFDFICADTNENRLLLGHEGNKTLDVFDLDLKKLLKAVPMGPAQDVAIDLKRGNYYVSGNDPGRMVTVDMQTLGVTGVVPMPTNTDLIAFNPMTGFVHVCNDVAAEEWIVDPVKKRIVSAIMFDGTGVEDISFDPDNKCLYQAVKGKNTVAVVDAASGKVRDTWPCAPDKGVHGIALVETNGLLVACAGKLLLFDRSSGKIVATAPTTARVDEIAYDPGLHQAYCAGRSGSITVVAVEADKLTALGDVPKGPPTGSITVDPKTHEVWIAYVREDKCYVQPFTPVVK